MQKYEIVVAMSSLFAKNLKINFFLRKASTFAVILAALSLIVESAFGLPYPVKHGIDNIYCFKEAQNGRYAVWIVKGDLVRDSVYPEWLYGGNAERYRFNPLGEIWIDNDISCQEYRYTLAHELCERHLMAHLGWTYDAAHDSALMVEDAMRRADSLECALHEQTLAPVPPIDCDSTKELPDLPQRIKLRDVYLQHFGTVADSLNVWIVDGDAVRRDIFPDFGFSGNDKAYYFVPRNEIWLDNSMSCEDIKFSLLTETVERRLMAEGLDYDSAYEFALHHALRQMDTLYAEAREHFPIWVPNPPDRDTGTSDEATHKIISQTQSTQRHEVFYRPSTAPSRGQRLRWPRVPDARILSPTRVGNHNGYILHAGPRRILGADTTRLRE